MKGQFLIIASFALLSFQSNAQAYSLSASYSPTLESYTFGIGMGSADFLMDFQMGISDEFLSMGMDLGFAVTDDLIPAGGHLSNIYVGFGGEMYLMDETDRDLGYAVYPMVSISYNLLVLSYGYGFLEYDGIPAGDFDGFHKIKLTLILSEIVSR
ncbi:MAG: hypothetical protein HWD92_06545 [Flavobacteriia bacterium]|nr:hypothetical protein [Flavobacteriia bacterium]